MPPWRTASRRSRSRSSTDPDVQSLSSFIGVDGNNVTLNSGRFLINLKPRGQRTRDRRRRHPAPAQRNRRCRRHHAVHAAGAGPDPRQHRQPHPVPIHPGERRSRRRCPPGRRSWWRRCASSPELADVVSNQEDNGLAAYVTIDRDSAARLGISVGTVDNALYDAFGQRIVSTIFTQSNQYRVIMEADPAIYRLGRFAGLHLRALRRRRPGAALGHRQGRGANPPASHQSSGAISRDHGVVQPARPAPRSAPP